MKSRSSYVPPPYIPLGQSDEDLPPPTGEGDGEPRSSPLPSSPQSQSVQWSSGICACCDDMQSCFYLALPGFGCFISCYACGYRRALRSRYNLQEAPCGDFATHFFCHLCAICQEYREIRERAEDPKPPDLNLAVVTAPDVQTMESSGL
ncbi:hypothetical protein Goshw_028976 [Gossypium schwendimanii]|uniref:Uncharacterized protein n=1 Tax=Gossypium schwendimanii TaxID=34291 RepID=A0A7J9MR28_GOSSC|nr:hypothetical protein [Gossypium schwendimanii]